MPEWLYDWLDSVLAMSYKDLALWLSAVIFGGAVWDALKNGAKYAAKYLGRILPAIKRFHLTLFELRNQSVANIQLSHDFYARAFAFSLYFGLFALGLGIDLAHRYYLPESSTTNEIWFYGELIAMSLCSYLASLWLGAVFFITKARLEYGRRQAAERQNKDGIAGMGRDS